MVLACVVLSIIDHCHLVLSLSIVYYWSHCGINVIHGVITKKYRVKLKWRESMAILETAIEKTLPWVNLATAFHSKCKQYNDTYSPSIQA